MDQNENQEMSWNVKCAFHGWVDVAQEAGQEKPYRREESKQEGSHVISMILPLSSDCL